MGVVTRVSETAEAICGALHKTDFAHLGDEDHGRISWFTRGTAPAAMRVGVFREDRVQQVHVTVEWANVALPGRTLKAEQILSVDCGPGIPQRAVKTGTEQVVLKCLLIYRDLVGGTGIASAETARTLMAGLPEVDGSPADENEFMADNHVGPSPDGL